MNRRKRRRRKRRTRSEEEEGGSARVSQKGKVQTVSLRFDHLYP